MTKTELNIFKTYDFDELKDVLGTEAIVAIDTSIGTSIAVGKAGKITEISSDDPFAHTEVIGTLLDEALKSAGVEPSEVRNVVQGIGPGPFTGLRIGLVTAQTFALALNIPILSLVSHDAVALEVLSADLGPSTDMAPSTDSAKRVGHGSTFRIIQDAKRRELFVSEYSGLGSGGIPIKVAGPVIESRAELEERDSDLWPERVSAAALLKLAIAKLKGGHEFESSAALYLRQPDVNLAAAAKFGAKK